MIRLHIIRTIIFALIGVGIGYGIYTTSPKIYEGRVQLVLGSQAQNYTRIGSSNFSDDVASILQAGLAINPQTEVQILKGEGVFRDALNRAQPEAGSQNLQEQFDDLYGLFDVNSSSDASAVLIRARAFTPEAAAAIANQLAEAYNDRRQDNQREAVQRALDYLSTQLTKTKGDLTKAEEDYKKAKEESSTPDMGAVSQQDISYQAQLRANLDLAQADLVGTDRSISQTESAISAEGKYEEQDLNEQKSATLTNLEVSLADLERQKQTLLVDYYEDSTQVRMISGTIAATKTQIAALKKRGFENTYTNKRPNQLRKALEAKLADLKINRQATQERISRIQSTYDAQVAKVGQLPATAMKLMDLEREVTLKDGNYRRLMIQSEDLKNRTEATAKSAVIVNRADPDPVPVLPRPQLIFVVAVLGGAIFGLLFSFAIEAMRLRIYSSTQLQELTGLPIAGVVHDLPGPTARKLLTSLRDPNPVISESYRFLAYAAMSKKHEGPRTILMTGVDSKAGCSTTAAQFATALAQAGSRVLLIDCALEDPTITKVFGLEQKSGVGDILSQTQLPVADSQIGSETATPNLRVLGAGTEGRNAIKMANTSQISALIGALAQSADVLVLDTVSCLSSSDAARLVPYVEEVFLVTSAKAANMRKVAAAIDVMTLASAASIKFVVTKGSRGEEAVMRQSNLAATRA